MENIWNTWIMDKSVGIKDPELCVFCLLQIVISVWHSSFIQMFLPVLC